MCMAKQSMSTGTVYYVANGNQSFGLGHRPLIDIPALNLNWGGPANISLNRTVPELKGYLSALSLRRLV